MHSTRHVPLLYLCNALIDGKENMHDTLTRTPLIRELTLENDILVNIIYDHLKSFMVSKPSGCPKISSKLYLAAFKVLGEQLAFLFNLSIKTNKIPVAWKKGIITPIPKKGDKRIVNNIRPITYFKFPHL